MKPFTYREPYIISNKQYKEMEDNGWIFKFPKDIYEGKIEMFYRLSKDYYYVKLYKVTTRIRGHHQLIAFVKGEKY